MLTTLLDDDEDEKNEISPILADR